MIDTDVRALFTAALGDDMPAYSTPDQDVARGRSLRRRRRHGALAGLAAATSLVLAIVFLPDAPSTISDNAPGSSAGSTEQLPATVNPHILLDDPDWEIWKGDLSDDGGRVHYKRGIESLLVMWYQFDDPGTTALGNYRSQGVPEVPGTLLGREVLIFEPSDHYYELVWQDDQTEFAVAGQFDSIDEFKSVTAGLYEADDETWQTVMQEATRRYDNAGAIAEIAANVPRPDGFSRLDEGTLDHIDPTNEQLLTQEVLHWIACDWVRLRLDGAENQDSSYVDDHLREVLEWAKAHDAVTEEAVWDYAEAIVAGEESVNGRPLYDLFYASEVLRCGGW